MKAIFLDRDGTIVKDYPDEQWKHVTELELFPDSIEALQTIPKHFIRGSEINKVKICKNKI